MRNLITAGLLAAAIVPTAAQANPMCGDRATIVERLEQRFSETPAAIAVSSNGALVEVLVSPDGSWTMLVTHPGKDTCIAATGKDWEALEPRAPAPGEKGA